MILWAGWRLLLRGCWRGLGEGIEIVRDFDAALKRFTCSDDAVVIQRGAFEGLSWTWRSISRAGQPNEGAAGRLVRPKALVMRIRGRRWGGWRFLVRWRMGPNR